MKKKQSEHALGACLYLILLKMKLTLLILFIAVMETWAVESYAQTTRLTLKMENASIEEVLKKIEDRSEFRFFYNGIINVDQLVSVDFKDRTVADVLKDIFDGTYIQYKVMGRQIMLSETESASEWATQQPRAISGKVTDSSGAPLPGVTILIKNTSNGTITDINGNYEIPNVPANSILIFSFVGMKSREIAITGEKTINVQLDEETVGLEEVVAVGYGTQKKVNLTGAVTQVSSKILESRPIVNLGQGLQGVIPNLNVSFGNGAPGKAANFNIRGDNSINGGDPLVLVDGVQMDINLINPSDIESISVLKDGSSAAIYGARAGYGVILIKTKSGTKKKATQVTYNGNIALNTPNVVPRQMESLDFVNYKNAASMNAGGGAVYSDEFIQHVKNYLADPTPENAVFTPEPTTNDPGRYGYCGNTDWYKATNKANAISTQNSLGISGGTDNTSYYGSVSYLDQGGFLRYIDDSYKRVNTVLNIDTDINEWLSVFAKTTFNNSYRKTPFFKYFDFDEVMFSSNAEPLMPVYHPDGNYSGQGWWTNFVALQKEGGSKTNKVNDSWLTGGIRLKPFKDLVVNFDYTYNYYANEINVHLREYYEHYADPTRLTLYPNATPNYAQRIQYNNKYHALNLFAQYNKTIGKNAVSAVAGFNQEDKSLIYFSAKRENLINNDFASIKQAIGNQYVEETNAEWAIRGAFLRLNYAFNDKYLLEFDSRYDGSSRFPSDSRFAFFPSGSMAWRISNENFFEPLTNVINELKIRASYSSLGNQNLGSSYYPYIPSLSYTSQVGYMINGSRPAAINAAGLVSGDLTWETIKQFNLGLDFGLFQNKLTGTFDIYQRSTKDMLTSGQTLPAVLGTAVPQENAADLKTNGFEFTVNWKSKIGDLSYFIGATLSDYHSEITRFSNPQKTLGQYYVGQKLGEIWGYKSYGLFQTQTEVDNSPTQSAIWGGAWAPGDVKYEDLNKDKKISNGKYTVDDPGDLTIIGNSTPRFRYSVNGGFEWKNFDFGFLIQGIAKRDAWLSGQEFWGFVNTYDAIPKTVLDSWSLQNTDAYFPRPYLIYGHNNQTSSRYLQNASYLRIKSLTLGYTLPKVLTQKILISDLRIYVSGENLFTFTGLNKNFDPEIVGNAFAYPIQRSVSFGVNVKF